MGDLEKNFSRYEFACNCGCGFDGIFLDLVNKLQKTRTETSIPMVINSGCRCKKYNKKKRIGGHKLSSHLTGKAADILCDNSYDRYALIKSLMKYFFRIHIGENYIHVDVDDDKLQNIIF